MITYTELEKCRTVLFPYIIHSFTDTEPAPEYEYETSGVNQLQKVLEFVRNDDYYPSFFDKASYLMCSVAGAQYFSNGNKRLSVVLLLDFLTINYVSFYEYSIEDFKRLLLEAFSEYEWQVDKDVTEPHPLFLYNLAIAIGDRKRLHISDFTNLREIVAAMLQKIYPVILS